MSLEFRFQELLPIVLLDSARLQKEDAAYKKKRHKEALDQETLVLLSQGESPFHFPGLRRVRSVEESKASQLMQTGVL